MFGSNGSLFWFFFLGRLMALYFVFYILLKTKLLMEKDALSMTTKKLSRDLAKVIYLINLLESEEHLSQNIPCSLYTINKSSASIFTGIIGVILCAFNLLVVFVRSLKLTYIW